MHRQLNTSRIVIDDPITFFYELGGLHDADIKLLSWNPITRAVTIVIDDLNSAFEGLTDYIGPFKTKLEFNGIENLTVNFDLLKGDTQRIYKMKAAIDNDARHYEISIRFSPSGTMLFNYGSVEANILR